MPKMDELVAAIGEGMNTLGISAVAAAAGMSFENPAGNFNRDICVLPISDTKPVPSFMPALSPS